MNLIIEAMSAKNWNQSDLAAVAGKSKQYVSDILNNKRSLDTEGAILLGAALGLSPEELLLAKLREEIAKETQKLDIEAVKDRASIESRVNLRLLQEDGIFSKNPNLHKVKKALAPTLDTITATQRRGSGSAVTPKQAAWLAAIQLRIKSWASQLPAFQSEGLLELAKAIPSNSANSTWLKNLPSLAAEVGVVMTAKKAYPGAALHGAAFKIPTGERTIPVVALTAKGGRADSVIFTLLHEIGHHLLGHTEGAVCVDDEADQTPYEKEANEFAAQIIGTDQIRDYPYHPSRQWIETTAHSLDIPQWFVLGHLQNLGAVPWASPMVRNIPNIQKEVLEW